MVSSRLGLSAVIAVAIAGAAPAVASAALAWEETTLYKEDGTQTTGGARVGDVTGDGIDDIVIAHSQGRKFIVLRGLGGAQYAEPVDTSIGSAVSDLPGDFAVVDLDGDSIDEVLATTNARFFSLRGTASGALVDPLEIAAEHPRAILPANLDADADIDLVLSYHNEVRFVLGNGDRTFTMPATLRFGPMDFLGGLAAGDLNGAGTDDVVTAEDPNGVTGPARLETYVDAGGGYQRLSGPVAQTAWTAAGIGEFTGDAFGDVLATDQNEFGKVQLFPGDGTGALLPPTALTTDGKFEDLAVGDFDHDGFQDAMGVNSSVRQNFPNNGRYPSLLNWIRGGAGGVVVRPATPELPRLDAAGFGIVPSDLNGDGFTDFVISGYTSGLDIAAHLSYDDLRPPDTELVGGPGQKSDVRLAKGKAKIRFRSNERGAYFACKLDDRKRKPCRSPLKLPRLKSGDHVLVVSATDLAGNRERKPAKLKFTVG